MGLDCLDFRLFCPFNYNHMVNLRENEEVLQIKRRHLLILLIEIIPLALLLITGLVTAIVTFFIPFSIPEILVEQIPGLTDLKVRLIVLYFISIGMIIVWQILFVIFANYYLDCWIITSERTIHTELKSLFHRALSSVPHETIQDITVNVTGIIPTFLKYGDLQIQTAGKFQEFIFKQIPEPYKTKEVIFKAQKEYLSKRRRLDHQPEPATETNN